MEFCIRRDTGSNSIKSFHYSVLDLVFELFFLSGSKIRGAAK